MQVLGLLLRTLLGVPLFLYIPGYLLDRAILRDIIEPSGIERHIMRVVISALLTGWIALVLAEFGGFGFWILLGIIAILCAIGLFFTRRYWPKQMPGRPAPPLGIVARGSTGHQAFTFLQSARLGLRWDAVLLVIAIVFGVLVARPFEVIRGGLDAGVYANTGISIAHTGGITIHDPIIQKIGQRAAAGDTDAQQLETNLLGVQSAKRFLATRLRATGFLINAGELAEGRVVPQFFHLWPTWIAICAAMLTPSYALLATGAAGLLGVVLLGLIGRKLGGGWAGLLAAAMLAVMTPQVWFSRMPTSEALTQALLLAGTWAFLYFADVQTRRERIWWGMLTGLAFGEVALTRIDFPLAIAPLAILLLYVALTRRWDVGYTALGTTIGLLLVHTILHTLLIARAYFFDTYYSILQKSAIMIYLSLPFLSPELRDRYMFRGSSKYSDPWRIWIELTALALGIIILIVLWRHPRPLLVLEKFVRQRRRLLLGSAVLVLGILSFYSYLIRPGILTQDVMLHPFRPDNWLKLQGYVGAPIDAPDGWYKETLALSLANMARLGWYLSPLGVILGVIGGLMLWWRLDRRSWILVVVATIYALFYINSLYGTGEQTYIYILRRYVPLVYPAFILGIAYALAGLRGLSKQHRTTLRTGAATVLAAALLLFFVVTGRTAYAHTEYAGAFAAIDALSKRFDPRDIILVRGGGADEIAIRDTSELIATPLTFIFERNALAVKGRMPGHYAQAFSTQVTHWRDEGRHVYLLLSASGGDMTFPGYTPQSRGDVMLSLREFQQLRDQKPKLSYINEVPFHLYELVPDTGSIPLTTITYDDTAAQVAGFYRSEAPNGDERAAWTDGKAVLRLPATAQGQTVTLRVAGGTRPHAAAPAHLCIDVTAEPVPAPPGKLADVFPWQPVMCANLPQGSVDLAVHIPTLQAGTRALLRLQSTTWVPSDTPPDPGTMPSPDGRELGIRFISASPAQ